MDSKETLEELLKRIKKATGLNQTEIAERAGYERPYLSQAKKTDSTKLIRALQSEFKTELENLTLREAEQSYLTGVSPSDKAQAALINMLILEIAKLRSKVFGVSVDDAIDELERNARIALRQVEKGGAAG